MSMTGEPGGRPLKSGIAIYDVGAGLTAVYAILAACIHQMKTGEGQHIDIALAECGLPWFVWEAGADGTVPEGTGSRHRVSAPYQAFGTRQGYIMIGAANQRTWERLCADVLERPELITDPRFVTNSDRLTHIAELEPILEAEFARAGAAEWIERCERASVPCGPINDFGQAMQDPHWPGAAWCRTGAPRVGHDEDHRHPDQVLAHARRLAHGGAADGAAHRRGAAALWRAGREDCRHACQRSHRVAGKPQQAVSKSHPSSKGTPASRTLAAIRS